MMWYHWYKAINIQLIMILRITSLITIVTECGTTCHIYMMEVPPKNKLLYLYFLYQKMCNFSWIAVYIKLHTIILIKHLIITSAAISCSYYISFHTKFVSKSCTVYFPHTIQKNYIISQLSLSQYLRWGI